MTTDCTLCDRFIWATGGLVNGRSICADCMKNLAEQSGLIEKGHGSIDDALDEEIYQTIYHAVEEAARDAAERAIATAKRKSRSKAVAA